VASRSAATEPQTMRLALPLPVEVFGGRRAMARLIGGDVTSSRSTSLAGLPCVIRRRWGGVIS
jgi:hypothetical protein